MTRLRRDLKLRQQNIVWLKSKKKIIFKPEQEEVYVHRIQWEGNIRNAGRYRGILSPCASCNVFENQHQQTKNRQLLKQRQVGVSRQPGQYRGARYERISSGTCRTCQCNMGKWKDAQPSKPFSEGGEVKAREVCEHRKRTSWVTGESSKWGKRRWRRSRMKGSEALGCC